MNEIFSFRKELNIKKIVIVILILLISGCSLFFIISHFSRKQEDLEIEDSNPYQTFEDSNKTINLTLPKTYGFIQYKPSNNYLLELRTEDNLNIFISQRDFLEDRTLSEIASADIKAYIEQFNNYSNLSEVKEFEIDNGLAYTYCFHYLDSKTKTVYYLQVFWIEKNDNYYIIDVEFPLDSLNTNSGIINEVLDSLIIN